MSEIRNNEIPKFLACCHTALNSPNVMRSSKGGYDFEITDHETMDHGTKELVEKDKEKTSPWREGHSKSSDKMRRRKKNRL